MAIGSGYQTKVVQDLSQDATTSQSSSDSSGGTSLNQTEDAVWSVSTCACCGGLLHPRTVESSSSTATSAPVSLSAVDGNPVALAADDGAASFTIPDNPDYNTDLYQQEGADQLLRNHVDVTTFGDDEESYYYTKQWQTDPESGQTFVDPTMYDGTPNENKTVISYALRTEGNEIPDEDSGESVENIPWTNDDSWNQTLEWSLQAISDVANIEFVETEDTSEAQVLLQHYAEADSEDDGTGGSGYAYLPAVYVYDGGSTTEVTTQSSVNMNILREPSVEDERINGWRNTVLTHELGHAVSLPHPGDYNLTELVEQGVPVLHQFIGASRQDTEQYSIMAYPGGQYSGADYGGEWVNPFSYNARSDAYQVSTPQLFDILALQELYGVNTETRADDTVYGFNSTADRDHFDFDFLESDGSKPVLTIYDAGGSDTLDLSGYDDANLVNLYGGNFSNVGGLIGNVAIFYDTVIENAVGGTSDDTMLGNDSDNQLSGEGGADIMMGQSGGDSLTGGAGDDTLYGDSYRFTSEDTAALQSALEEGINIGTASEDWLSLVDSNPVIADIWDKQLKIAFNDLASTFLAETSDVGYAELIGAQYRSPEEALADSSSREDVLVDSTEERNELIASLEADWNNTQITFLEEQEVLIDQLTAAETVVASAEEGVVLASSDGGSGGSGGYDIALYQGNQNDYALSMDLETGAITVADGVEGRDGTDLLYDVEEIAFADGSVMADEIGDEALSQLASADSMAKQLESFSSAAGTGDDVFGTNGLIDRRNQTIDQSDTGILAA